MANGTVVQIVAEDEVQTNMKKSGIVKAPKHKWAFATRFRYHAFGWRAQPAILRVNEAVAEIKAAARHGQMLAAEGAVLLLKKLSPALGQVDN